MPLTDKGREILAKMEKEYGTEQGERVFYASANKGAITGVHGDAEQGKLDAVVAACNAYDRKDGVTPKETREELRLRAMAEKDMRRASSREDKWRNKYGSSPPKKKDLCLKIAKAYAKAYEDFQNAAQAYGGEPGFTGDIARGNKFMLTGTGQFEEAENMASRFDDKGPVVEYHGYDSADQNKIDDVMAACDEYERKDVHPDLGFKKGEKVEYSPMELRATAKELISKEMRVYSAMELKYIRNNPSAWEGFEKTMRSRIRSSAPGVTVKLSRGSVVPGSLVIKEALSILKEMVASKSTSP